MLSVVYWARFRIWGAVGVAGPVVGKRKASCNNRGSDKRSQSKASYWAAVEEHKLSYYSKDTLSFTTYPIQVPYKGKPP